MPRWFRKRCTRASRRAWMSTRLSDRISSSISTASPAFNRRAERPTAWELEVHTSPDYFERMLKERPGNVVVLSGRNGVKIDRILASVKGGLHVLADKPWILKSADLPKVEAALAEADAGSSSPTTS